MVTFRGGFRRAARHFVGLGLVLLVTQPLAAQQVAHRRQQVGPPIPLAEPRPQVEKGEIGNASDREFRFRLRRNVGPTWTDEYVLQPGQVIDLHRPPRGERSPIAGVGLGYVIAEYPAYGGLMRVKLTAQSGFDKDVLVPYYYYITDANGIGMLVQTENMESARDIQTRLQAQKPKTPEHIAWYRRQLELHGLWFPPNPYDPQGGIFYGGESYGGEQLGGWCNCGH